MEAWVNLENAVFAQEGPDKGEEVGYTGFVVCSYAKFDEFGA